MNHVNWDTLPETMRQFIRGLVVAPEGSVIEQNGEPMVRVMPIPNSSNGTSLDVEWTEAKNQRRCDLIDREINGTIMPDERVELEDLQQLMRRYANKVAPLPLEHARQLLDELERRAAAETPKPFGERYAQFKGAVPDLPADLAEQHEHYRLGTPKR
jgi:hypothetical protein